MLLKPSVKSSGRFLLDSEAFLLSAITVLAALLRIYSLTSKSLWMDEGFSIFMGQTSTANFIHFVRGSEMNMVLYYWLLRGWMHLGNSELFIKLLSVIPSVATAPVIYFLGRRLFDRRLALIASLLLALHPAHIAYAQEARGYALAVFLISLSSLFFLRTLEQPSGKNWATYAVLTILAIYSHMFAALVVLAHWTAYFAAARRTLRWSTVLKIVFALALPLGPMMIFVVTRHSGVAKWIERPAWNDVLELFHFLTLPKYWMFFYLLGWGVALWAALRARSRNQDIWPYQFLFAWLLLPIFVALSISLYRPVLVSRFLLICAPAAILVAAAGLSLLQRWARILMLAAMVLGSFNSALSYYRHPQLKEDWRGTSVYLLSQAEPEDNVIVLPGYGRFTFDYYREVNPAAAVPLRFPDLDSPLDGERIWLIVYESSDPMARDVIRKLRNAPGSSYCEIKSQQFNLIKVWLLQRCDRSAPRLK